MKRLSIMDSIASLFIFKQTAKPRWKSAIQKTGPVAGFFIPLLFSLTVQATTFGPIPGMAENRLVITVAPQKLIWPHGST